MIFDRTFIYQSNIEPIYSEFSLRTEGRIRNGARGFYGVDRPLIADSLREMINRMKIRKILGREENVMRTSTSRNAHSARRIKSLSLISSALAKEFATSIPTLTFPSSTELM
jgi:hypothetical protein